MGGGLPGALGGTGRLSIVRLGGLKCRTAVLVWDGGAPQGETCVFGVAEDGRG